MRGGVASSPPERSGRDPVPHLSNGVTHMPAKSAAQQKAAGAALSAKRGDTPKRNLKGASKEMVELMSEAELERMASTGRRGQPEHIRKDD